MENKNREKEEEIFMNLKKYVCICLHDAKSSSHFKSTVLGKSSQEGLK